MRRDDVLKILRTHETEIRALGVTSMAIFGSYARDQARPESDIDILVEVTRPTGLLKFVGIQQHLEQLLGLQVDLVTPDALRPEMRERIFQEALYV